MRWKKTLLAALVSAVPAAAAGQADTVMMTGLEAELHDALAADVAASPSLPGQVLHVHAPAAGVDATLVAGLADRAAGVPLEPGHGFRVASVTKTFTAAAVLRLVEEGRVALDDAIGRVLPAEYVSVLREGGYDPDRITVRHLLTHTGGVYDYATDERFHAAAFGDPGHRWSRMEQVRAAMEWGSPRFEPGEGFHYSDTGYVLLGALIERLTRLPLAEAFRTLLDFERLGLDETYLESLEPPPCAAGQLAIPYFGEDPVAGLDPSVDLYGGGGLVSSAEDLARFYRALLRGEVFRDPATLEAMTAVPAAGEGVPGGAYAMALQRRTIGGEDCWGHTGFWGTAAFHCPASDVTIVRHTNQAQPGPDFVFAALFARIAEVLGMGTR